VLAECDGEHHVLCGVGVGVVQVGVVVQGVCWYTVHGAC